MDRVAAAVGLAPDELRRRNFIRAGDTSAVGQVIREPIDMGALLDRALAIAGYHAKRARFDEINPGAQGQEGHRARDLHARRRLHRLGRRSPGLGRGPRGGGRRPRSRAVVEHRDRAGHQHDLRADRGRRARRRSTTIDVAQPDTSVVPDSGPTVASRTCMVVGKLVESAARGLVAELKKVGFWRRAYRPERVPPRVRGLHRRRSVRCARPPGISRPRACAGTTRRIRAMPTAPMRGPSTSPRSPSTRRRGRRAWTTSSRCRKSGR